jgi:hypothetical protein
MRWEEDIHLDLKEVESQVVTTRSGSCPMAGFSIGGVEPWVVIPVLMSISESVYFNNVIAYHFLHYPI